VLVYAGDGDPGLPKERIEAYAPGVTAVIDDFRQLDVYQSGKRRRIKGGADKGHRREVQSFLRAIQGIDPPPSIETYLASTRATLALADSLRTGRAVEIS
jgi:hypothetical protein